MSNKNIIIISTLSIIAIVIATASFTYAYLSTNVVQEDPNVITSTCFDLELNDTNSQSINLTKAYPINDEASKDLSPYTFTVTNNCNTNTDYKIILNISSDTDEEILSFIKYSINNANPTKLSSINSNIPSNYKSGENFKSSYVIKEGNLNGESKSESYELRLWIDEGATLAIQGQTFSAQLSVYSEAI